METGAFVFLVCVLLVVGYFLMRYLDGDLTIDGEDKIMEETYLHDTRTSKLLEIRYVVKRKYQSGRIKIFNKTVKVP